MTLAQINQALFRYGSRRTYGRGIRVASVSGQDSVAVPAPVGDSHEPTAWDRAPIDADARPRSGGAVGRLADRRPRHDRSQRRPCPRSPAGWAGNRGPVAWAGPRPAGEQTRGPAGPADGSRAWVLRLLNTWVWSSTSLLDGSIGGGLTITVNGVKAPPRNPFAAEEPARVSTPTAGNPRAPTDRAKGTVRLSSLRPPVP